MNTKRAKQLGRMLDANIPALAQRFGAVRITTAERKHMFKSTTRWWKSLNKAERARATESDLLEHLIQRYERG